MRGLVFCSECNRRMHVKRYLNCHGNRIQQDAYKCGRNDGIEDKLHKHTISVSCSFLDQEAWEFAVEHIRNPKLIHAHIKELQEQIPEIDHAESLEESISKLDKAIKNLYELAEVAIDTTELQERLVALQLKKRDLERLHMNVSSTQERQEELRKALERFETWAIGQQEFLDDPEYSPSLDIR